MSLGRGVHAERLVQSVSRFLSEQLQQQRDPSSAVSVLTSAQLLLQPARVQLPLPSPFLTQCPHSQPVSLVSGSNLGACQSFHRSYGTSASSQSANSAMQPSTVQYRQNASRMLTALLRQSTIGIPSIAQEKDGKKTLAPGAKKRIAATAKNVREILAHNKDTASTQPAAKPSTKPKKKKSTKSSKESSTESGLQVKQSTAADKKSISKTAMGQLQKQLRNLLIDAAVLPHWQNHASGFQACQESVKLLFQLIFTPPKRKNASAHFRAVQPTESAIGQCLEHIVPVLLMPKQAPAQNIMGVAEFLQDIIGLSREQIFKCICEEPSVLHLDVYRELMPMQDYFSTLQWEPKAYNHMIVKHPQILLLPLQQYQRNIGYLLGQGLEQSEILDMWLRRAGLLIEPLRLLHGEVLALRQAGRSLQDLALPAKDRIAPLPQAERHLVTPGPGQIVPQAASAGRQLKDAISAVVGTPQAVYKWNLNAFILKRFTGVHQTPEAKFYVKGPFGKKNGIVRLEGLYDSLLDAAKVYDRAVLERFGLNSDVKLNFPVEASQQDGSSVPLLAV